MGMLNWRIRQLDSSLTGGFTSPGSGPPLWDSLGKVCGHAYLVGWVLAWGSEEMERCWIVWS